MHMVYDGTDRLFLRTEQGVFSFSLSKHTRKWLYSEENVDNDGGQDKFATAMFFDEDILWIGSDRSLVKILVPRNNFHLINPYPQMIQICSKMIQNR